MTWSFLPRRSLGITAAALVAAAFAAAACAASAPSGSTAAPASGGPTATPRGPVRPVVIDTDMAADDWLAILFLLGRPEVEIVAVTVTGTGEAHCDPGVRNALALVALGGRPDIPVVCGAESPLAGSHAFPAAWRESVDALFEIEIPDGPGVPVDGSTVDLMAAALLEEEEPVTLLTLGPLTNVGDLIESGPDLTGEIAATVVMGGAVRVDGNVGASGVGIDNRFAEWNVYVDPVAAKLAMEADLNVTLVPLDATNHAPATQAFVERLAADATTPQARFASDVLDRLGEAIASGGYYFWDPLAAAILVDESLTSFETGMFTVVTGDGPESGRIVEAPDGPAVRFAVSADVMRFEQAFIDALNGRAR